MSSLLAKTRLFNVALLPLMCPVSAIYRTAALMDASARPMTSYERLTYLSYAQFQAEAGDW